MHPSMRAHACILHTRTPQMYTLVALPVTPFTLVVMQNPRVDMRQQRAMNTLTSLPTPTPVH
eukprot:351599-Chlamydomonas_euryale.AAC.7